jgi:hypothetical protein
MEHTRPAALEEGTMKQIIDGIRERIEYVDSCLVDAGVSYTAGKKGEAMGGLISASIHLRDISSAVDGLKIAAEFSLADEEENEEEAA